MKIETLKKDRTKEFVIGLVLMVVIITSVMFATSKAKYRYTKSIPLVKGTIKYSAYDFQITGIYLNSYNGSITGKDGKKYKEIETMPDSEYKINETNSYCNLRNENNIDTEAKIYTNESGEHVIENIKKGDNCYIYFDIIDNDAPIINNLTVETIEKTSITVKVTSSDNKGIAGYYYKIGTGSYEYSTSSSKTFKNLAGGTTYTVYVYVIDNAGNRSEEKTLTVTTENESLTPTIIADIQNTGGSVSDGEGTSYYYTGDPNNWVQFGTDKDGAKIWWRIIRVNGSGSVRMIYQGTSTDGNAPAKTGETTRLANKSKFNMYIGSADNMYVGYWYTKDEVHGLGTASTIYGVVNDWYKDNIAAPTCSDGGRACNAYIDIEAGFCNDRTSYTDIRGKISGGGTGSTLTYYGAYIRIKTNSGSNATFACSNGDDYFTYKEATKGNHKLEYPVGLITADEVQFAGITYDVDSAQKSSYLYTGEQYWTMSPFWFPTSGPSHIMMVSYYLGSAAPGFLLAVRPVINLSANALQSGSGTEIDPYRVS